MTSTRKTNKAKYRRGRGFARTDGLVQTQIRSISEGRGFAVSRVLTNWPEIVGEDLARLCRPVGVAYGRHGLGATLTLLVRGAAAPMVQAQLPRLLEQVNACYGHKAIARIKLTQTAPEGFAEGATPFQRTPKEVPAPAPEKLAKLDSATQDVADPDLRAALSGLGRNILSKTTS